MVLLNDDIKPKTEEEREDLGWVLIALVCFIFIMEFLVLLKEQIETFKEIFKKIKAFIKLKLA